MVDRAHARTNDPKTAKDAAATVDVSKLEYQILEALKEHGPSTFAEIALYAGRERLSVSPRLKPLLEKNRVFRSRTLSGKLLTRPGPSGRQRQVYEYQSDQSLWCERPIHQSQAALRQRIEELEALNAELLEALELATHELNAIRAGDGAPQHIDWHQGRPLQTDSCTHEWWNELTEKCFAAITKAKV
tara:strand:+ start:6372 stop:6935 length:564 start_codon:yes stop_codon:yes gene_type:complete